MKFFNFHLMPYRHADLDAIAKNGSAWVTFSNRHYDPQKGAELYHDYLDQMEFADKLGFDGVCLNEHHQTAYGMMPIPGVLAGALARSVKRAKLTILGRALPLLNNPLMVAEEYAILDNLTRGRLIAGFVRGIGAEYHAMGINPAYSQERFAEATISSCGHGPSRGPSPTSASTISSNTSIPGRGRTRNRIRRSGYRRKVPARPSAGPRVCATPIARR